MFTFTGLLSSTSTMSLWLHLLDMDQIQRFKKELWLETGQQAKAKATAIAKANQPCSCIVCDVGRMSGHVYVSYAKSVSEPAGRPRIHPLPEPEPMVVCNLCMSAWWPGQKHDCSRQGKRINVEAIVRNTIRKSKERVISSQLKEVFEEKGVSTRGGSTALTTGGTPIIAMLGKTNLKPVPKFSNESLTQLQLKMGNSDRKMNILGNFLRINCGRASVNKLEEHIYAREESKTWRIFWSSKNSSNQIYFWKKWKR